MGDISDPVDDEVGFLVEGERPLDDFELEAILRVGGNEISDRAISLRAGIARDASMDIGSEFEYADTWRLLKPDLCGLTGLGREDVGVCGETGNPDVFALGEVARVEGDLLIWRGLVVGKATGKLLSMTLGVRARRGRGGICDI